MSAPFGGHPTLAHYLHWIRETGGYAQSGFRTDRRGKAHSLVKIVSAEGKSVVVVGAQDERLPPTYVAFLDRRLGVKSPWFSVPE